MMEPSLIVIEKFKLPYWIPIGLGIGSATMILVFTGVLGSYPLFISSSTCNNTAQFWSETGEKCLNYYNYSQTCKNDTECDYKLGLICKQTSNSNKSCDCPETSGNVSYWNGSICVKSLDYNSQCNSSILHQCRTDLNLLCINNTCSCDTTYQYWSTISNSCLNYGQYTETCSKTTDCISKYNLVCNSNSTSSCNCPASTGAFKCDCLRTFGNESYWNGSLCVNTFSYNSSCLNSLTNYMCQTLTQGTVCSNSTGSYLCECKSDQYFNGTQCLQKPLKGESCTNVTGCRTDLGLGCVSNVCVCQSPTAYWALRLQKCVSVAQYIDPCTKTADCDPDVMLVCNTVGTTCNCPITSANNKCDCPRTLGNEYFWNGTSCTLALAYSSSCFNSSTSYMCQTLTQSTICNNTSTNNYTCECPLYQYYNVLQNKCASQQTDGGACTVNIGCRLDLGLYCNITSGSCQCNKTYSVWSSVSQKCIGYSNYSEACNGKSDCSYLSNLQCNSGTSCNCPLSIGTNKCDCIRTAGNEYFWNGSTCTAALTNGTKCTNSSTSYMCQTLTQGTVCNGTGANYVCQCPSGQAFEPLVNKCVTKQLNGGNCSSNIGCRTELGLLCLNNKCQCNSTFQFWSSTGQICRNYYSYAENCTSSGDCNPSLNLICNNGTPCNCPTVLGASKCDCQRTSGNEYYWNGTMCVLAASFNSSCTANNNYTCQTLTQKTSCSSSGYCVCPTNGNYNSSLKTCVSCDSPWWYYNGFCYRISTTKVLSDATGASVKIDPVCDSKPNVRLAKIDSTPVYNFVVNNTITTETYWVDASYNSTNTKYASYDGLWVVNSTQYCSGASVSSVCTFFNRASNCYDFLSCGGNNKKLLVCQYVAT